MSDTTATAEGVDRSPRYLRVAEYVMGQLRTGALRGSDRLPSERELCETLDVSRVTVRKALNVLEEQGLVVSAAGRGWFVAGEGPIGEPPNSLMSFTQMGARRGLRASAVVLEQAVRRASMEEAEALGIAPGAPLFALERLRLLDGTPIAVDRSLLPLAVVPDIAEIDFNTASLYEQFRRHGLVPMRADVTVQAVPCPPATAPLLEVEPGVAVLRLNQTTFDQGGRAIELGQMQYPGDRYQFHATLHSNSAQQRTTGDAHGSR
jgi:DNA-binding GntR family transcriptional regulator